MPDPTHPPADTHTHKKKNTHTHTHTQNKKKTHTKKNEAKLPSLTLKQFSPKRPQLLNFTTNTKTNKKPAGPKKKHECCGAAFAQPPDVGTSASAFLSLSRGFRVWGVKHLKFEESLIEPQYWILRTL